MEHVKSKGTDLQNTKDLQRFKTQRTQTQTQPSISSKPRTSHEKLNPPYKHQTQKQTHKFQIQIQKPVNKPKF